MSNSDIFSDSSSIDSGVDDLQNPKFDYTGTFDRHGFRDRYGCQTWDVPFRHKYAGYFLYNNMHEKGFYFMKQQDGISFYDGQFYNNKLEGYGQVIHNDGKIHEGLFKDNIKFGPGVLSYPDGTQDVGLWNGNYLIRLSLSVSSDIVPSLCNNPVSRIKLLRFKKIVPALPKTKDVAKDLMSGLSKDDCFAQKYPELYNPHVRNEHSLFFDRRLYDLTQLGSEDTLIDVLEDEAFVDCVSEVTDSEDALCPCSNDRCVHITKQISEIESELLRIREIKAKYKNQLKLCKTCCKTFVNSPPRNTPKSPSETSRSESEIVEDTAYPSEVSIAENVSSKQGVIKNLDQMRLGMSDAEIMIDVGIITQDKEIVNKSRANSGKGESINKIFMCAREFQSDQSSNNSNHDTFFNAIEKYTCTCIDEEIPEANFLMEQLKKLEIEEKFYQRVLDFLNKVLFREISTVTKTESSKTVKVQVEELLSWNNGKTAIEILQHSFRYRNFENILNFKIKSIFIGDRAAFGNVGTQETICINFLNHCFHNQLFEVRRDLFEHNVYPDLADARGNTGLHFAVTGDCHDIMRQLANIGANLDVFNDECLTPLLLSILRYIATLNRVAFWERAFLSEIVLNSRELDQVTQWRPHESLVSLREFVSSCSQIPKHGVLKDAVKKSTEDIGAKIRSRLLSSKSGSIASRINLNFLFSTSFIEDYEKYKKAVASKKIDDVEAKDVEPMAQSIDLLLHYGADPNIGDLPMKPILLSIFTKNVNLIEKLLKHDANPDSLTDENLTGLHIISTLPFSSENVQIAEKFLMYSSDPNRKCGNDFWFDQNEELIGTYVNPLTENEDYDGKTPLQMVTMRKDFDEYNVDNQCQLVKILLEYGALHDQYYLGHTILSMAVLRGNKKLIETLYHFVEFEQSLGENMGNALTILGLCRYPFVKSFSDCKKTIDTLIALGMNPFNPVYDFPNIFEFFLCEYSHDIDFDIPRVRVNLEAEDVTLRKTLYSSSSDNNKNCNMLSVAYLKEIGRHILTKVFQYKAIQILLRFAEQDLLYHECLESMAKSFTISEALDYLKVIINKNKITIDSNYRKIVLRLLNFIKVNSLKITKKASKKYLPDGIDSTLNLEDEVFKLSRNFTSPTYVAMYALDSNPEKYEVCFHCMRKSDKKLLCCPCCGTVKFCSEMCNRYSNKSDTKHSCDLVFYNEKKNEDLKSNEIIPLTGIDLLMHEAKRTREEERFAELMRRQAEEEEKLKKQLRRSQKMDSQLTLRERKSQPKPSRSGSVVFITDAVSKKKICCKEPSAILLCDQMAQVQPRKLNCGFHCGQIIPDVHLDVQGNVIREQEFCECYPLYKKDDELSESKERGDQIPLVARKSEDNLSRHYSLSDIYGGIYSGEEKTVQEAQQLDTLVESLSKDGKGNNQIIDGIGEQEVSVTETEDPKLKLLSGGDIHSDEIEIKEDEADRRETKEELTGNRYSKTETKGDANDKEMIVKAGSKIEGYSGGGDRRGDKEKSAENKTSTKKKKGKVDKLKSESNYSTTGTKKSTRKKARSDSSLETGDNKSKEITKKERKREDSSKSDEKTITKTRESKKKGIPSDSSLGTGEDKSRKTKKMDKSIGNSSKHDKKTMTKIPKKMKKGTASESTLDIEDNKTKKISKMEKRKGKTSKHDKKTMTKIPKSNQKFAGKEPEPRDDTIKPKKSHRGRSGEIMEKRSDKVDRLKRLGKIEKTAKKKISGKKNELEKMKEPEKRRDQEKTRITKKISEKHKIPETKRESGKKMMKDYKKEPGYKQKNEMKKGVKKIKSGKHDREDIPSKKEKQEKLKRDRSETYAKPKSLVLDHTEKIKRDAMIGKTLASMRALDARLLHPEKMLALNVSNHEEFQRISKVYQYFLELIAKYFPDFDLSCLMLPFACFLDGQLYYKFADALPYYCRTYSAV